MSRLFRAALLMVSCLFLLGTQCGDEFDPLIDAICLQHPGLKQCNSRVFVTSTSHNGDLGGLAGADQICRARAAEAGLDGTFVAWLSTSTVDAKDRLAEPRGQGFVRVDGALVATSIADLTDGSIANPIQLDENGTDVGFDLAWTGTRADGTHGLQSNCSDWTTSSPNSQGSGGFTNRSDEGWSQIFGANCGSPNAFRLYCFEVP